MEVLSASENYEEDRFEDLSRSDKHKKKKDKKGSKSKEHSKERISETPPMTPLPDMSNLFKVDFSHLTDIM